MYVTLTRPVSLYPEGASAAQWALKLKPEQIKVTVGGAQPATGHTMPSLPLCLCVQILLPFKLWHVSREGAGQTAVVLHADLDCTIAAAFFPAVFSSDEYYRIDFLSRVSTSEDLHRS